MRQRLFLSRALSLSLIQPRPGALLLRMPVFSEREHFLAGWALSICEGSAKNDGKVTSAFAYRHAPGVIASRNIDASDGGA